MFIFNKMKNLFDDTVAKFFMCLVSFAMSRKTDVEVEKLNVN